MKKKIKMDPANAYLYRLFRYDSEEQTYTGAPEEADDKPTGKPTTKHPPKVPEKDRS
jgi:hypothetical protein